MKESIFEEIRKFTPEKKLHKPLVSKFELFRGEDYIQRKEDYFQLNPSGKMWRTIFVLCFTLVFFLFFIGKAYVLQIIKKDTGVELSDQNRIRHLLLQPERGVIYDRNGKYIVRNKPAFSIDLYTNACSLGDSSKSLCKSVINSLATYFPIEQERIFTELDAGKSNIILATGLTKEQILPLETNLPKFPGISIVTIPQRDYLHGEAFAHLVGYVGIGGEETPVIEGKMGIENSYDQYLAGSFGNRIVQVDALGNYISTISEKPTLEGKNMILYTDLELQKKAYELLKKTVDDKKAHAGVVVAQDPSTGGILALVSYPSFNPDKMSTGISKEELDILNNDPGSPFFNRAISAVFPPGSTFKMVLASAALSEKTVSEDTVIVDPGYVQVGSFIFRNWKLDGHGEVNLRRALQVSNDTYFYTIGGGYGNIKGLGIEKISKWAKRFGFGDLTGIDIKAEVTGYMPDGTAREWYLGDTYITSIGQGDVLATPLQVNNYVSYFANGGKIMKPQVVKSVDGVFEHEPKIVAQNLTTPYILSVVRDGMKMAVQPGGTAYPLFDFPQKHQGIELGGKTGTSEYIDSSGEPATHAWLSVFGPFDNATIALTVFLEGGGGGSDDAAPIARELLDLWFKEYEGSVPGSN